MLVSEFYDRTGVELSFDEFWDLNEAYNRFAGTIDEFCALWCEKNKDRVEAARQKELADKIEGEKQDRFFDMVFYCVSPKRGKLVWRTEYRYDRNCREMYKALFAQKAKLSLNDVERLARRFLNSKCFGSIEKNLVYALTF